MDLVTDTEDIIPGQKEVLMAKRRPEQGSSDDENSIEGFRLRKRQDDLEGFRLRKREDGKHSGYVKFEQRNLVSNDVPNIFRLGK